MDNIIPVKLIVNDLYQNYYQKHQHGMFQNAFLKKIHSYNSDSIQTVIDFPSENSFKVPEPWTLFSDICWNGDQNATKIGNSGPHFVLIYNHINVVKYFMDNVVKVILESKFPKMFTVSRQARYLQKLYSDINTNTFFKKQNLVHPKTIITSLHAYISITCIQTENLYRASGPW